MNILLVEDDHELRTILREILESFGHQCTDAFNGQAAKEILEGGQKFDLLISDFRMPRMDGTKLLAWCRDNKIHFPVIFITANADLFEQEKLALADCCAALLSKPVGMEALLKSIDVAKSRRHIADCKPSNA